MAFSNVPLYPPQSLEDLPTWFRQFTDLAEQPEGEGILGFACVGVVLADAA